MNIHEHQAKEILKEYGAPVPRGIAVTDLNNLEDKLRKIDAKTLVLKAQIHAGGRGKAGGVKLIENRKNLFNEAKLMLNKKLVTHQTGPEGRQVKRLYIEEASEIKEEFSLRFCCCNFYHSPIFKNVLVNFSFDPMHSKRNNLNSSIWIKSINGFHQSNISFLK